MIAGAAMTMAPGTRLGPYEILALVGAGGMGEVYAAHDARLDRKVAIKVLHADASSDTDRRQRFEREARAASALNHPNICTIHEIGSAEGRDYICFEYVDGVKALALPDSKASGLRSLALLDMFEGRYGEAEARLREAIVLNRAAKQTLSEARNLMFLAQVREGRGARAAALVELDKASELLGPLDTDVGWYANLGTFLARAGVVARAKRLVTVVAKRAEPGSPTDMSNLHRLEGEIALAERRYENAIDSLALADREMRNALALESLANAYRFAGNSAQAVATYEALLAQDALGWEAQPAWFAAHYALAEAYRKTDQRDRARETADRLLNLWREADSDLPLLEKTRALRRQLDR